MLNVYLRYAKVFTESVRCVVITIILSTNTIIIACYMLIKSSLVSAESEVISWLIKCANVVMMLSFASVQGYPSRPTSRQNAGYGDLLVRVEQALGHPSPPSRPKGFLDGYEDLLAMIEQCTIPNFILQTKREEVYIIHLHSPTHPPTQPAN